MLLGRANPHIPPDVFCAADLSHKKRWRVAQAVAENFWWGWLKEYLPSLTERIKWYVKGHRRLCVGDVVLVIDKNTPRGQWPLGLIAQSFPDPTERSGLLWYDTAGRSCSARLLTNEEEEN